ncbi:MAG: phosphoribosylformylglycinamidine synthase subunit PurS [Bacteroidia bacterium]
MKFQATIHIMPRPEILDPQGKATLLGLHNLGFDSIETARIGKRIEVALDARDEADAAATVDEACRKLLANLVIERYSFELQVLA